MVPALLAVGSGGTAAADVPSAQAADERQRAEPVLGGGLWTSPYPPIGPGSTAPRARATCTAARLPVQAARPPPRKCCRHRRCLQPWQQAVIRLEASPCQFAQLDTAIGVGNLYYLLPANLSQHERKNRGQGGPSRCHSIPACAFPPPCRRRPRDSAAEECKPIKLSPRLLRPAGDSRVRQVSSGDWLVHAVGGAAAPGRTTLRSPAAAHPASRSEGSGGVSWLTAVPLPTLT